MKTSFFFGVIVSAILTGCASTSTTMLAQDVVRIDVSAAPACSRTDAQRIINRTVAIETLRLGFDRYLIQGAANENNVRVVGASVNPTGFGGATVTPIVGGSRDAVIIAQLFRNGQTGSGNAIDARTALGNNWQQIVADGPPNTCNF